VDRRRLLTLVEDVRRDVFARLDGEIDVTPEVAANIANQCEKLALWTLAQNQGYAIALKVEENAVHVHLLDADGRIMLPSG
jgi:hypothetical protein